LLQHTRQLLFHKRFRDHNLRARLRFQTARKRKEKEEEEESSSNIKKRVGDKKDACNSLK